MFSKEPNSGCQVVELSHSVAPKSFHLLVTSLNPRCSLILLENVGRLLLYIAAGAVHIVALIESQFHGIKLERDKLEILLKESSVDKKMEDCVSCPDSTACTQHTRLSL